MTKGRFAIVLAGLAVAAMALTGCSGDDKGSTATADGAGDGTSAVQPKPAQDADEKNAQQPTVTRAIVRTGYLDIETSDIDDARQKVVSIVTGLRGLIASEHSDSGEHARTELVVRVPSPSYDAAMNRFQKELGKTTEVRQESTDVTEQVVDVESRIASQRASIERMRTLLAKANTVAEIVSVEGELTRREADLEALLAKQKALEGQTELAGITVTLTRPGEAPPTEARGFLSGLSAGWKAFTTTLSALATAVGAVLPFALAALVVAVPVWLAYRSRRRPTPTD